MPLTVEAVGMLISGAGASGALIACLFAFAALIVVVVRQIRRAWRADDGTHDLIKNLMAERDRAIEAADTAVRERNAAVQDLLAAQQLAETSSLRLSEVENEMLAMKREMSGMQHKLDEMVLEQREANRLIQAQSAVIEELRRLLSMREGE
ncbi:hypothetical protein CEK28_08670 [Xenophilus sp. AP218F]|nr:hypothetical protein CEK28_08670 [Xenophilus sp. AP218F]